MIEKIRELFDAGHPMTFASKLGVRNITIQGGAIDDPLGEVSAYILEKSYDGRITLRFYHNSQSRGYVQYRQNHTWAGNNRSVWSELRPLDLSIWTNLKDYVPEKKVVVNPHVEPVRDRVDFSDQFTEYDWEPSIDEAVVLLVHRTNSNYESILPLLVGRRDLIVEVDDLPIAGKAAVVKRIKELAPNAHVVEHKIHFGLGYLIVNCHKNVFAKYNKAMILTDELIVSEGAVDLAFNLLENNSQNVIQVFGSSIAEEELDQTKAFEYNQTAGPMAAYCLCQETAQKISEKLDYFATTFLQNKYESRSHQSIRGWLKTVCGVMKPDAPTGILDVVSALFESSEIVRFSPTLPRAVKSGKPYSNKSDSRRKKFTLGE